MCIMPVGEGAIRVTTGWAGETVAADISDPVEGGVLSSPGKLAGRWRPDEALITALRRLPSLGEVGRNLSREVAAQWDRVLLWTPVAFGAGAAIYLGLKREPPLFVAGAVGAVAVATALLLRRI